MNSIPACISIICCILSPLECQVIHEKLEKQALLQTRAQEGILFLESLIEEMNIQYGIQLNLSDACQVVKANIDRLEIPDEIRRELHSIADSIESGVFSALGNKRNHEVHSWKFISKKKKKSSSQESLILPDKLAAGFVCAFAGALLCIVPGGQSAGLTLIGTGLALAVDGMSNGERPYYEGLDKE